MWKFVQRFFGKTDEARMADQYDQLLNEIQKTFNLNRMVYVRKKILDFRIIWGVSALSTDLYKTFEERLKFIMQISQRKHAQKRNDRQEAWKTKENL